MSRKYGNIMARAARGASIALVALLVLSCGKSDKTLVTVGDRTISDEEFEAFLRFKNIALREGEQSQRVLDEYVNREALAQAIEESDLLDKKLLAAELDELRKEMLISRYFDQFLKTSVTDDAVANYYKTHAKEYEDKKVHVAHILIRTHRRMSDEEKKAALTKAQEAHAQLAAGKEFADVASQLSEDRVSASRGGDLGWIREGSIDARFSQKAFGMETGTYSEPFETAFGYHIVKVVEAAQSVKRPLSAVEGDIRYQLRSQAKQAEMDRLLKTVKTERREGGYKGKGPGAPRNEDSKPNEARDDA